MSRNIVAIIFISLAAIVSAAPRDRITGPIDSARTRVLNTRIRQLADPKFDRGAVDPSMEMSDVMIMFKLSADQQADLDRLLADQQNPSSAQFHKWLAPEDYANRFGLSQNDHSKVAAWLHSQGFTVTHSARSRNWISFRGSAAQISKTLHTSIHKFAVDGKERFSNVAPPSVPEALADVIGGFIGLDNFGMKSNAIQASPDFNSGTSHYLAPDDFATIYNLKPLYDAGFDGTGQSIAIVGESDILITDIRTFRTRYNLPANDPKLIPYSTTDPGFTSAQIEANLDIEWAGAIAPKATINYIYGPSALAAMVNAIESNVAPVISVSFGTCEINASDPFYRSIGQQANAQGITILVASGDEGGACFDRNVFATHGKALQFPSVLPEVTSVGGTQFVEGGGNYWASSNSNSLSSAISYIPEAAWNESSNTGIASTGGGASIVYPKPAWQSGPGVPDDNARHTPDIALSAALHDAYLVRYLGSDAAVGGTSASAPSMAGIVAILNQYVVAQGIQKTPGLGNINPQLYRLAQAAPSIFHDIVTGDNIVPCAQGSPDCTTGSFGYKTGPNYDMATGLGSIDANALVTQWNAALNGVAVNLSADATRGTVNDTIQLTATVAPATGSGTPTGVVNFVFNTVAIGSAPLGADGSATVSLPLSRLAGTGTATIAAEYSGDARFSSGGATLRIQVTLPTTGAAAVIVTGPSTVLPTQPGDAQGISWNANFTLRELAGVPAMVTGFSIDGKAQTLAQFFQTTTIAPSGSLTVPVVLRNITQFSTHTFVFSGTDSTGHAWSRQLAVAYHPVSQFSDFSLIATPLVVSQNTSTDPSCRWSVQLNVDDLGGFGIYTLNNLAIGTQTATSAIPAIFGTPRLVEYGGLQGQFCFGGVTPPASELFYITRSDGAFNQLTVSFAGPPANPTKLTPSPASVSMSSAAGQPATANLSIAIGDKTQSWTASIFPANRTTGWLSVSQLSGVGSGQLTLIANGTGYEPGVYRATISLQSPNAIPQVVNVPVIFTYGADSGVKITSVANSFSYTPNGAPGMLLSIFGSGLAGDTPQTATGNPYPYTLGGVSAAVNGIAAPIIYASSTLVNIQIPYEAGSGPAVVGLNNNGKIAGFQFEMAAAAPGIFVDAKNNVLPSSIVTQGGYGTVFLTGAGEVTPARLTGRSESLAANPASLPKPVLPVSVTVGGIPAFVQFVGLGPGKIGTTQINFIVPQNVPLGPQQVVVTIGGISSPPATIDVVVTGSNE